MGITMESNPSGWSSTHRRRRLEIIDPYDDPVLASGSGGDIEGMCNLGELTDQGIKSSQALGAYLRSLYVDRLRFLPSTITDLEMVYLRATRIPRALGIGSLLGDVVLRMIVNIEKSSKDYHIKGQMQLNQTFINRTSPSSLD